MSSSCSLHRLPRAGVDRIDSELVARSMLGLMVSDPMRTETIVLLLDHERRGIGVLVVSGTIPLDSIFDVLDVITSIELDELGSVVVASVRRPVPGIDDLDELDVDRWLECSSMLEDAGIELVEWFVIGRDVQCPRDLVGEPPRW
jgi:hypothetical protein